MWFCHSLQIAMTVCLPACMSGGQLDHIACVISPFPSVLSHKPCEVRRRTMRHQLGVLLWTGKRSPCPALLLVIEARPARAHCPLPTWAAPTSWESKLDISEFQPILRIAGWLQPRQPLQRGEGAARPISRERNDIAASFRCLAGLGGGRIPFRTATDMAAGRANGCRLCTVSKVKKNPFYW